MSFEDDLVDKMNEKIEILSVVESKIIKLNNLYQEEKKKNVALVDRVSMLEKENMALETNLQELEKKYENLKFAKTIASSEENEHDAKIKINRIVREIDNCLALLNR